jgi:hypothetical protein
VPVRHVAPSRPTDRQYPPLPRAEVDAVVIRFPPVLACCPAPLLAVDHLAEVFKPVAALALPV